MASNHTEGIQYGVLHEEASALLNFNRTSVVCLWSFLDALIQEYSGLPARDYGCGRYTSLNCSIALLYIGHVRRGSAAV